MTIESLLVHGIRECHRSCCTSYTTISLLLSLREIFSNATSATFQTHIAASNRFLKDAKLLGVRFLETAYWNVLSKYVFVLWATLWARQIRRPTDSTQYSFWSRFRTTNRFVPANPANSGTTSYPLFSERAETELLPYGGFHCFHARAATLRPNLLWPHCQLTDEHIHYTIVNPFSRAR